MNDTQPTKPEAVEFLRTLLGNVEAEVAPITSLLQNLKDLSDSVNRFNGLVADANRRFIECDRRIVELNTGLGALAKRVARLEQVVRSYVDHVVAASTKELADRIEELEQARKADDDAEPAHTSPYMDCGNFKDDATCVMNDRCKAISLYVRSEPWLPTDRPAGWEKKPDDPDPCTECQFQRDLPLCLCDDKESWLSRHKPDPIVLQVGDLVVRKDNSQAGAMVACVITADTTVSLLLWLNDGSKGWWHNEHIQKTTPADGQIRGGRLVKGGKQ